MPLSLRSPSSARSTSLGHLSRAVSGVPGGLRHPAHGTRSASPASSGIQPGLVGSATGTATLTASEARSGTVHARPSRPRPPVWWSVRTTHQRARSSSPARRHTPRSAGPSRRAARAARVFVDPRAGWNSTPRHGRPDVTKAALTVSMSSESRTSTRLECRAWQPITPSQSSRPARRQSTTPEAEAAPGPISARPPASSPTSSAASPRWPTPGRSAPSRSSTPAARRPPASASRCSSTRAPSSSSTSTPGTAATTSARTRTGPTATASSPATAWSTVARWRSSPRTSPSSAARSARSSARRSSRSWTSP